MIGSGFAFLAEIRQQQEQPRQALLARIEQLIDQIRFDADGARQQMRDEHLGERRLVMEHADDRRLLQPHDRRIRVIAATVAMRRACPARQPSPKNSSGSQDRDDRFLALLGDDGDLDLALLDVEDRIGGIALREDDLRSCGTCRCSGPRRPWRETTWDRMPVDAVLPRAAFRASASEEGPRLPRDMRQKNSPVVNFAQTWRPDTFRVRYRMSSHPYTPPQRPVECARTG